MPGLVIKKQTKKVNKNMFQCELRSRLAYACVNGASVWKGPILNDL
jgi:hypothetical protein